MISMRTSPARRRGFTLVELIVVLTILAVLADGYRPIVFCRFIDTAEYVAEALRSALKGTEVAAVTGELERLVAS